MGAMQTKERRYPKHREFVGRPEAFDYLGGRHFMMLFALGLREHHRLLDFGCGSLRSGRLIIPYLASGNYYGIEPNQWLVRAGIQDELGESVLRAKEPGQASYPCLCAGVEAASTPGGPLE